MENLHQNYVYLDGAWLGEDQLLKLAADAGSYGVAEHYLVALLVNAVVNGRREVLPKVNEVRRRYGVQPIPYINKMAEEGPKEERLVKDLNLMARQIYGQLSSEERVRTVRNCLLTLIHKHHKLFTSRACWNGIFLVIRDRVDRSLKLGDFTAFALEVTPCGWPRNLGIGSTTMGNFSHYVDSEDREEAYYDMASNPWQELCDRFWEIIKEEIFTNDLRIGQGDYE